MNIIVNADTLDQVKEAIKRLPVNVDDFNTADQWVGIVLVLENMIQTAEVAEPKEDLHEVEE